MRGQRERDWPAAGLPEDTPILTPSGWTTMANIRAGAEVVDAAGRPCRVVQVHSHSGPTVRVTLADGSTISAGRDQMWQVEVGRTRALERVTSTEVERLVAGGVGVRLTRSQAAFLQASSELILNPLLLGFLLGDGGLSSGDSVVLWTQEVETRRRAEAALPAGACFSDHPMRQPRCIGWPIVAESRRAGNPVLDALRQLGLSGVRSYEKRVPLAYLWAGVPERLALLNGLLDTDGGVTSQGGVSFSSASPQLAADVLHLVRSLGGRGKIHVRQGVTYTVPSQCLTRSARDSYRVTGIRLPDYYPPFLLSRKANRVRPTGRLSQQWTVRSVGAAEELPLLSLVVDGPSGLFLAKDFVPVASYAPPAHFAVSLQAA